VAGGRGDSLGFSKRGMGEELKNLGAGNKNLPSGKKMRLVLGLKGK